MNWFFEAFRISLFYMKGSQEDAISGFAKSQDFGQNVVFLCPGLLLGLVSLDHPQAPCAIFRPQGATSHRHLPHPRQALRGWPWLVNEGLENIQVSEAWVGPCKHPPEMREKEKDSERERQRERNKKKNNNRHREARSREMKSPGSGSPVALNRPIGSIGPAQCARGSRPRCRTSPRLRPSCTTPRAQCDGGFRLWPNRRFPWAKGPWQRALGLILGWDSFCKLPTRFSEWQVGASGRFGGGWVVGLFWWGPR